MIYVALFSVTYWTIGRASVIVHCYKTYVLFGMPVDVFLISGLRFLTVSSEVLSTTISLENIQ